MGAAGVTLPTWLSAGRSSSDRPNVVVILADDMGFSDVGSYGGEINTSNLDRLSEGDFDLRNFTTPRGAVQLGPLFSRAFTRTRQESGT
jgi:hypothetical protein